MTNIIMLENFYAYKCTIKSISGKVLALGLHLDDLAAGLDPGGPGCPETPSNDQYYHT